jgi:DNA-nicking Smr family endonuclease
MKRPPSNPIPELSAPPRRKRGLSEEERTLWESVAKQIKPLRKRPRAAKARGVGPDPETPAAAPSASPPKHLPPARIPRAPKPALPPAAPPLAPLGRRERSQLSRGRKEIDARLDLHGMTQTRAHRALFGFLQRAHSDGLTFVLVITGKGKMGSESERGVLRRQVPQWLSLPEFRSLVVGFEEAHIGHGGEGALYVRVRRSRI